MSATPEQTKKVLVIEDEPISLYLLSTLLQDLGASVSAASLGKIALQTAAEEFFDLILADSQLPDINGIEVIKRLRASERHANTPIIAISAYFKPEEKKALEHAGVDGYQTKPIEPQQLEQLLHTDWRAKSSLVEPKENSIDWELCLKNAAGKHDLAQEILQALMDELPQTKQILQHAMQANDLTVLEEEAHKLHGVCCYTGLPLLKQAAFGLEKAIVAKQVDLRREARALITEIDAVLLAGVATIP